MKYLAAKEVPKYRLDRDVRATWDERRQAFFESLEKHTPEMGDQAWEEAEQKATPDRQHEMTTQVVGATLSDTFPVGMSELPP